MRMKIEGKIRNSFIYWMILISSVQIFVFLALGMVSGFGEVTYGQYPFQMPFVLIVFVLARECVRRKILSFYNKRNRRYLYFFTILIFAAADWNLACFLLYGSTADVFLFLLYICKAVAESVILTYGGLYAGAGPGALYCAITELPLVCFPMLISNESRALIVRIVFLLILYREMKKDIWEYCPFQKQRKRIGGKAAAAGILCLAAVTCMAYPFMLGKFPVYPVAIASGSMQPQLETGDMAIILRTDCSELREGDIIQFQSGNSTVIHRINEVVSLEGERAFITKGDSNRDADAGVVSREQVKGRVVMHIPFLGWLTLWIHNVV